MDASIYNREDVKRSIGRIDARHEAVERGEDLAELTLWADEAGRLWTIDAEDNLFGRATCIYSPLDGGKLL